MRVIIAFAAVALLAVAHARPQYSYQNNAPSSINVGLPLTSGVSSGGGGHRGGDKYLPPSTPVLAPIVHKQYFVISAPEDHGNGEKNKHLVLGRPQKNYRVVFIKAPGGDNGNVKYSAEFAPQEEKTVIYVLSKKDNDLNANDIATPAPTQPSKPEVFFIKYKTDDEAKQAQKEIQGKYDLLGGTSEFSDEGHAPVTSVIGSLDGLNPDGSYNYRQINGGAPSGNNNGGSLAAPNTQYLPAAF